MCVCLCKCVCVYLLAFIHLVYFACALICSADCVCFYITLGYLCVSLCLCVCLCLCQCVSTMHAHVSYLNQRLADREGAAEQNEQMCEHCGGEVNVMVNSGTGQEWKNAEVSVENEYNIYVPFSSSSSFLLNDIAALVASGAFLFIKHFGFLVCLKSAK